MTILVQVALLLGAIMFFGVGVIAAEWLRVERNSAWGVFFFVGGVLCNVAAVGLIVLVLRG